MGGRDSSCPGVGGWVAEYQKKGVTCFAARNENLKGDIFRRRNWIIVSWCSLCKMRCKENDEDVDYFLLH